MSSQLWHRSRFILGRFRRYYSSKMPSALIILSQGAEEMETVISADVLTRGGVDVTVAGLNGVEPVKCSRNIVIKPDTSLDEAVKSEYDIVLCPGGMEGAMNLAGSSKVGDLLKKQESSGRILALICAAPIALKTHGIGKGKKVTSHPVVQKELTEAGYNYSEERVVTDGKLVTSRGPGTAFEFALELVETLQGKEKRDSLVPPMLLKL